MKDSVTLRPVMVRCFILLGKELDHNLEKLNKITGKFGTKRNGNRKEQDQ